jgi:hypothetical protein
LKLPIREFETQVVVCNERMDKRLGHDEDFSDLGLGIVKNTVPYWRAFARRSDFRSRTRFD